MAQERSRGAASGGRSSLTPGGRDGLTTPSRGPAPRAPAPPAAPATPRGEESLAGNRKLIRPQLSQHGGAPARGLARPRPVAPAERTGEETGWHARLAGRAGSLAVTLEDGQVLRGALEWYDRDCLKLRPAEGPPVIVMKHAILHVAREEPPAGGPGDATGRGAGPAGVRASRRRSGATRG